MIYQFRPIIIHFHIIGIDKADSSQVLCCHSFDASKTCSSPESRVLFSKLSPAVPMRLQLHWRSLAGSGLHVVLTGLVPDQVWAEVCRDKDRNHKLSTRVRCAPSARFADYIQRTAGVLLCTLSSPEVLYKSIYHLGTPIYVQGFVLETWKIQGQDVGRLIAR
jgi:hypothetical protein